MKLDKPEVEATKYIYNHKTYDTFNVQREDGQPLSPEEEAQVREAHKRILQRSSRSTTGDDYDRVARDEARLRGTK